MPRRPQSRLALAYRRMRTGFLWEDHDQREHRHHKDARGIVAAQGQPSEVVRLVKEITERRPQGAREDEGGLEERHA